MKQVLSDFYIDATVLEHGCCWTTAICYKTTEGAGTHDGDVIMLLECDKEDAPFIVTALNTASSKVTK